MNKRKILNAIDEVMGSLMKSARSYIKSINKKHYLEAESYADLLVCESARLHRAAKLLMDGHPLSIDSDDGYLDDPDEGDDEGDDGENETIIEANEDEHEDDDEPDEHESII